MIRKNGFSRTAAAVLLFLSFFPFCPEFGPGCLLGGEGTGALREGEGQMYYADAAGESVRAVKGSRSLNGEKVTTWTRVVAGGNVMEAEAGTNAAFASRGPSGASGAHAVEKMSGRTA